MPTVSEEVAGGEAPEYDEAAMAVLKQTRDQVFALLEEDSRTVPERLALLLLYGYEAQEELDGDEARPFAPDDSLFSAREFAREGSAAEIAEYFQSLELLTDRWPQLLRSAGIPVFVPECITLARYLVQRYWLQAVSDYDLSCRVKFMVVSCLLVSSLPGSFPENAQLFSKEIENNVDNVEALLDAAYTHPAFTDDKLLGLLLG